MPATSTLSLLRAYAALAWKNQQSSGGQAEERLKAPVGALVGDFGQEVLGLAASTAAEYRCDSVPGRPDIGVEVDALPVGFVELKAPGKGAKVAAFKDKHDKDQWAKLRDSNQGKCVTETSGSTRQRPGEVRDRDQGKCATATCRE